MKEEIFAKMGIPLYKNLKARVEKFCLKYQTECENSGKGTQYRTYREVAKRFSLTYDQIEDIINDSENLDSIVGFQAGLGGGVGEFNSRGEYQVEYIR